MTRSRKQPPKMTEETPTSETTAKPTVESVTVESVVEDVKSAAEAGWRVVASVLEDGTRTHGDLEGFYKSLSDAGHKVRLLIVEHL
jgi:hypothetical protein